MHQDYTHFKPRLLSQEEYNAIAENATAHIRGNGKAAKYPLPVLFQAAASVERFLIMHTTGERETPPRTISDEEFYTDAFAQELEFLTLEYTAALTGCSELMDSVRPSISSSALLACSFLNPLSSSYRSTPTTVAEARSQLCADALMFSLCHSTVPWTQPMYEALIEWYPAALLLCQQTNIPPMATPAMRTALEWAIGLDDNPKRRFKTINYQFSNMISPLPTAAANLDLPIDFSSM